MCFYVVELSLAAEVRERSAERAAEEGELFAFAAYELSVADFGREFKVYALVRGREKPLAFGIFLVAADLEAADFAHIVVEKIAVLAALAVGADL